MSTEQQSNVTNIAAQANAAVAQHTEEDGHDHDHDAPDGGAPVVATTAEAVWWKARWPLLLATAMLVTGLVLEFGFDRELAGITGLIYFGVAYLLAGYNVLYLAWRKALRLDFFNEFFLMSVATLGAFAIGEYSEGVAVMVFYCIGEWFQDAAVNRAKRSIKALLDIRPDEVTVLHAGQPQTVHPRDVALDETVQLKPGERLALDGELISAQASFDTAALTGESKPDTKRAGEAVYAGSINGATLAELKVTALFKDSKLSRILAMVQDATARKSQTQLFISRFAKVYTPIVFGLAVLVVLLPYFFVNDYVFREWLYRGLVFLVISCPCALVVSIPLGYFGGIGLASRHGILFKGSNFLDVMTHVNAVVMDKTGTLTKGVFKVQKVEPAGRSGEELVRLTAALEKASTHPIALAVVAHAGAVADGVQVENVEEISGHGLRGTVDRREMLAGNLKLLRKFEVAYPKELESIVETIVVTAVDGQYAGYITLGDEIKDDAPAAIADMQRMGIQTVMLSGDKQSVVDVVAKSLNITEAHGDLLPEGKVEKVQALKNSGKRIAFVGDGVNDAPVVALADAGIAMGGLGSDATIETADIVIQNDQPSKIPQAIRIGKLTRSVVWQNIVGAMVVKVVVLSLGAGGVANLWEAVIADVGVALLAILNAVRIQRARV